MPELYAFKRPDRNLQEASSQSVVAETEQVVCEKSEVQKDAGVSGGRRILQRRGNEEKKPSDVRAYVGQVPRWQHDALQAHDRRKCSDLLLLEPPRKHTEQ